MERQGKQDYYSSNSKDYSGSKSRDVFEGGLQPRDDLIYTTLTPNPLGKGDTQHVGAGAGILQGTVSEDELQILSILRGLKDRMADLDQKISEKEYEKSGIINDIGILSQRLKALARSITKKRSLLENFDKTIKETESAFQKITESTRTLVGVVKRDHSALTKALGGH